MAAIDFPDSPTIGDVFQANGKAWVWDGTVWGTRAATDSYISDTAPSGPSEGNTWFKSSTGQFFVRYDDHWIELGVGPKGNDGADGIDGQDGQPYGNIDGGKADTVYGSTLTVFNGGNAGSF